jgi:hypothetical protein
MVAVTRWSDEILPVLEAAHRVSLRNLTDPFISVAAVDDELGREANDPRTARALHDLAETGYFDVTTSPAMGSITPAIFRLSEKALQIVAGWPSIGGESFFTRMLAELDERVAAASTTEERTRLERLRDGLVGVGRDVFTNVVSAAAEGAVRGLA